MHYLSNKGFVHRDLAARNILVTQDNVLKVNNLILALGGDKERETLYSSMPSEIVWEDHDYCDAQHVYLICSTTC